MLPAVIYSILFGVLLKPSLTVDHPDRSVNLISYPRKTIYNRVTLTTSQFTTMASNNSPKTFIINHMNADHQDSLSLYLQAYNNVPSKEAKSAHLEDFSLTDLVITAAGTRYSVPINPPMKSLSDARPRVVAMHKECLERLGLSDIVVTEYRLPRGQNAVVAVVLIVAYALFFRRSNFLPGSLVYDWLSPSGPVLAEYCYNIQPILFPGMVFLHAAEAYLLTARRLRRHRVPFMSGLWCIWMVSTLIEGVGAWRRFDEIVEEKEKSH